MPQNNSRATLSMITGAIVANMHISNEIRDAMPITELDQDLTNKNISVKFDFYFQKKFTSNSADKLH